MINNFEKTKKIELLAPAKNKECAFAAINAGADAVYIGASSFGARKNAGNSIEDIKEITDYAHKFLVKVYVTLNTILFDNEVNEVEKIAHKLYEIGVDAIIFQDFSFFKMNLPPIALHASTQCNNDSLEKIKFLKQMNVERVVLPREFSIGEIKDIISNVDIETEVFVHGALCVSYSGQCYFSNYIGGRSANRGDCAQPCRKKYSLIDENGKVILSKQYLLSMKDNNLSANLKELINAGVNSLKIEGRLKDKDYVANVTAHYRKLLDKISPTLRPSVGILTDNNFIPDINKTFNRSYTNFFFDAKRKIFINPKTPKFTGEYAALVKAVNGNTLKTDTKIKFNISDKICYFGKDNDLNGTTITKISKNSIEVLNAGTIKPGTKLFRNYDSAFSKELEKAEFKRKLPVVFNVFKNKISIKTCTGVTAEKEIHNKFEKANNIDKTIQTVKKQLAKLGDTDFVCTEITIDKDFDLFIPISTLNEIRRELVTITEKKISESYSVSKRIIPEKYPQYPHNVVDYSFNISNDTAKNFYEECGANVTQYAPEHGSETIKKPIILMKTKHCLRDYAGMCSKKTTITKNLYLQDEYGEKYPLEFDCKNCIMKIIQNNN